MHHFSALLSGRNSSSATILVEDGLLIDSVISPDSASATFTLENTGTASGTGISSYSWVTGGTPSQYEVKADVTLGSLTSGTTGTWLALSSNRSWNVTRSSIGFKAASLTISMRAAAEPGVVLDTAAIRLEATVDAP